MTAGKLHKTERGKTKGPFFRSLLYLCCALPVFGAHPSFAEQRPKVALVLSGGGARGVTHIGVLRVLEREGVPIDLIVGVSYGALVGGLYAAGYSADDLQRIIQGIDWRDITTNTPDRRLSNMNRKPIVDRHGLFLIPLDEGLPKLPEGLFTGHRIHRLLNQLTLGATYRARNDFDRLPTPFRAIATDILSGEEIVLKGGSLGSAIRTSISIPGVFTPFSTKHSHLIDGGVVNILPVDAALDAGADYVIAVDCATPLRTQKHEIKDAFHVLDQALGFQLEERKIANRKRAHVLILPHLEGFGADDFKRSYTLIPNGERETEKHLDAIRNDLQALGISRRVGKDRPAKLPNEFDVRTWVDLPPDIIIDRVRIDGLVRHSQGLFKSRLEKFVNKPTSFQELEKECGWLYATGLFQTVDYHVVYNEGQTELVFHVHETSPREFRLGIHFDNDYRLLLLGEIAYHRIKHRISELHLRGMVGNLNFVEMASVFRPSWLPGLLAEVQGWDQERMYYHNRQRLGGYDERRLRARLGVQTLYHNWSRLQAGYQVEHVHIRDVVGEASGYLFKTSDDSSRVSEILPGFWLSGGIDTRDDALLPTRGIHFQTWVKWVHRVFSHKQVRARLAFHASPHSRLSVGLWSDGGYVTRPAPLYDYLTLGGAVHVNNAALPTVGLKRDELRVPRFISVGISIWKHVSFGDFLGPGSIGIFYQGGLYKMTSNPEYTPVHGFGIGGYLNTRISPIRVDLVSTQKREIKLNVAIGTAF